MLGLVFLLFTGSAVHGFDQEIHRKFETLSKHEFISYFNSLNLSWTATEYSEDIQMHFGAKLDLDHGLPTITHDAVDLPQQFDSREQWPNCATIREINNQGHCGSCYLFGAINSASDRTCIHANVDVHLSEQEGDCINPLRACDGGYPSDVLQYWVINGIVSEQCKRYDINAIQTNDCKQECDDPSIVYSNDKHFGANSYQVEADINTISAEIVKNGPVVVTIAVYDDFTQYKGGVYSHQFGNLLGYHAVRVLGYGVDGTGVDFWIVANSWGSNWGEQGIIRMKRGDQAVGLEQQVFAGLPRA